MSPIFSNAAKKARALGKAHKFVSALIVLALLWGGYSLVHSLTAGSQGTRYVLGAVTRGTIVASVSASGQVAALDQVDIKPKASGDVTWVGVKAGDSVRAGQALAYLDATDAKQAIADAEASLAQAKLQYQKDVAQAPIDYEKLTEAIDEAKKDLSTTYNDTFNTLSDDYLALPSVTTGLQNILYGYDLSLNKTQWNIDALTNILTSSDEGYDTVVTVADIAARDYATARDKYDASLAEYKTLTRYSESAALEASLTDSVDTTTAIAQALQSTLNLLDTVIDYAGQQHITLKPSVTTFRSSAQTYLSTVNTRLSALLGQEKSLDTIKKTIRDDERSLEIYSIGNSSGDNPISLQSSARSIADQERTLAQMRADLSDYTVIAPFSGTLASFDLKRYDSATTGTVAGTLITNQKIATLSLNEVDVAGVSVGARATLTFDAVEGLTLTGAVAEIDAVGSVSQGVVSYDVTIAFDTQDPRVKPGMSVNASIIHEVKTDTLTVPGSAVHTQGGNTYVEVFDPPLSESAVPAAGSQGVSTDQVPTQVPVEIGISDDTNTEVLSGLSEGAQVIVRSVTSGATQTTASAPSLFGGGGGRGGFGR